MDTAFLTESFNKLSTQLEGQVGVPIALAGLLVLVLFDHLILGKYLALSRYRLVGLLALALFLWLLFWFGPGSYDHFIKSYDVDPAPLEVPVKLTNTSTLATHPFQTAASKSAPDQVESDGTLKKQKQAIVVCIDVSGSMGPNPDNGKANNTDLAWTIGNDPDRLAILASHLLTDLVSEGQQVGAVFFNGKVLKVLPLTKIESNQAKTKELVKKALEAPYNGGTDITAGVLASAQLLDGVDGSYGKYLILLSDMEADPKNKPIPETLRDVLHQKEISAFSIGLGDKADLEQMRRITWEEPYQVSKADELPAVFKQILAKIWDTREVPQSQDANDASGSFVFDPFLPVAKEVNFIVYDHDIQNLTLTLVKPDGQEFTAAEFAQPGNYQGGDQRYRAFKVGRPDRYGTGKWSLRVNRNPDQVSFMQVLDLAINARFNFDFKKRNITVDKVRLVNISDGSTYANPDFYTKEAAFDLVVGLAGRPEVTYPLTPTEEGALVYHGSGVFDSPGSYQFFVRFQNKVTQIRSEIYTFSFSETNKAELVGTPPPLRMGTGTARNVVFKPTADSTLDTGRLRFTPKLEELSGIGHTGKYLSVGGTADTDQLQLQASRLGVGQKASSGGDLSVPILLHGDKVFDLPLKVEVGPSFADLLNLLLFVVFEGVCAFLALMVLFKLVAGKHFPPSLRLLRPQAIDSGVAMANRWFSPAFSVFDRGRFRLNIENRGSIQRTYHPDNSEGNAKPMVRSLALPPRSSYRTDQFSDMQQSFEYGLAYRGSPGAKAFQDNYDYDSTQDSARAPY
ncbi:MAG: vWA domain-containing protein [Spirochaetales bacterium]